MCLRLHARKTARALPYKSGLPSGGGCAGSLFSFIVNYDPKIFGRIIKRISETVDRRTGQDDGEK